MYMLVSGSNCCELNFNKEIRGEETLGMIMGNDEMRADVEEGEISDSTSVEEISEEDFKQEATVSKVEGGGGGGGRRVWTMQDLYKYQVCRGYPSGSGLHNLAWAQAVQNKPLNEIFVKDVDPDENSKRSSSLVSSSGKVDKVVIDDSGDEMEVKVVDVEKEEGELEEGEIDLDSDWDPAQNEDQTVVDGSGIELAEQVKTIREELESVTVVVAEKSFEGACSQLQSSIQRFQKMVFGRNALTKESLVQLCFTAIEVLNSAFSAMDSTLKERNKDVYSRLHSFVKSVDPPLFSLDQIKKLEVMMTACDRDKVTLTDNGENKKDCGVANGALALSSAVEPLVHNNRNRLLEPLKSGSSNFRGRGLLVPLLDLHKDHDEDSLPSPTREAPPSFPMQRTSSIGNGIDNLEFTRSKVSSNSYNTIVHPYETNAVKAVSSYQQKFNRRSFHMFDRLPSPTPSEGSDDVGGDDVSGEVSSSSTNSSFKNANPPNLGGQVTSLSVDSPNRQGAVTAVNAAPVMKPSAKSRDPRLRFANSDVATLDLNQRPMATVPNTAKLDSIVGTLSSRKQKTTEEPVVDGPAFKRQKNGLEGFGIQRDVKSSSGTGGWFDDTDTFGPQSINRSRLIENAPRDPRKIDKGPTFSGPGSSNCSATVRANNQMPATGTSTAPSLPTLLKDIAVNPTMLLNILKMGQQRLAEEAQQKSSYLTTSHLSSSKSALGALGNVTSSNVPGVLLKPVEPLQDPSQKASMNLQDESGKTRMKPRDPRRALHGNTVQNNESLVSEQFKSNGASTSSTLVVKDNLISPKPEGQPEIKQIPHVSVAPPDIAQQFTSNLKNIANFVSVSQALPNPITSTIPQNLSAQPVQTKVERFDAKLAVANSEGHQNEAVSNPDLVVGPSPQNSWGDVDLLFEGYDDHQKADIQRERARRIEEQNKMFAARKLCLVLDLDHTLLNSAKFGEVDPVHDEILRKKEEQEREKPHRHLFRFSHMGMWTKLRPGIWTFLERASKIFELHLYTMGNKVYATEMAKILDPKGVLFAGRVISKGDDGDIDGDDRVPKTKDLEGVLGMESCVLIIDDSIRVWPHNKLNLIVVERYTYFPCSRRQFGLPGPSLLEIDHDERPEDGTIASCLAVIERIHQNFFSHPTLEEVDVRAILASEQQKILANCRIVFSRIFPVGEANAHLHPLWRTAEQFGAVCTNQIDEQVTHVVANSLGTDKVNWALSTGRFVVYPGWVEASALLYRRANEQDFAVKP